MDRRRFEYHFEAGSADAVLAALASYQNDDGGFGHSLEPDIRTPASSAVATTIAFQILREIRAPANHALVRKGIEYFVNTYDVSRQVWPIVPPEVTEAPHAPWWSYDKIAETFGQFLVNPRAEIVGYLHDYSDGVPPQLLKTSTAAVLAHLDSLSDDILLKQSRGHSEYKENLDELLDNKNLGFRDQLGNANQELKTECIAKQAISSQRSARQAIQPEAMTDSFANWQKL